MAVSNVTTCLFGAKDLTLSSSLPISFQMTLIASRALMKISTHTTSSPVAFEVTTRDSEVGGGVEKRKMKTLLPVEVRTVGSWNQPISLGDACRVRVRSFCSDVLDPKSLLGFSAAMRRWLT